MPAVVVDSSVLIPPEVWKETTAASKTFGLQEAQRAKSEGWLVVQSPQDLTKVSSLPFNLQPGETEALALALELTDALLLVDDAQGRKAAAVLGIAYTGTLGVLLRAKAEGKIPAWKPVLGLLASRTTFWLSPTVEVAALKQAGES